MTKTRDVTYSKETANEITKLEGIVKDHYPQYSVAGKAPDVAYDPKVFDAHLRLAQLYKKNFGDSNPERSYYHQISLAAQMFAKGDFDTGSSERIMLSNVATGVGFSDMVLYHMIIDSLREEIRSIKPPIKHVYGGSGSVDVDMGG